MKNQIEFEKRLSFVNGIMVGTLITAFVGNNLLPAVKELACWIYYEDGSIFYCLDCVEKRMDEINKNREFADDIDYEGGDTCGYWQDYADTEGSHEAECCQCHKPLFTLGFD